MNDKGVLPDTNTTAEMAKKLLEIFRNYDDNQAFAFHVSSQSTTAVHLGLSTRLVDECLLANRLSRHVFIGKPIAGRPCLDWARVDQRDCGGRPTREQ